MPAQYEAILSKFLQEGLKKKIAQQHAARIYNAQHPDTPVGQHSQWDKGEHGRKA